MIMASASEDVLHELFIHASFDPPASFKEHLDKLINDADCPIKISDSRERDGYTATAAACHAGYGEDALERLKLLVEKGCPVHKDCLRYACEGGNLRIVKYLVEEQHCNVNVPVEDMLAFQFTPLHSASLCGQVPVMEYLLERGAKEVSLNLNLSETGTPLHQAIMGETGLQPVETLLKAGAAPNIIRMNWKGIRETALDMSKDLKDNGGVVECLLKHGAKGYEELVSPLGCANIVIVQPDN